MSLSLYNTLTRRKEEFLPADPKRVSVYVCGPTVYSRPHIGNARPAVIFDVLVRFLRTRFSVVYVRNITDIDDKINAAAEKAGVPIAEIAAENVSAYHDDMHSLGVLPPDIEPYATQHVSAMLAMIAALIESGHAYAEEGHVLFRVGSYPEYGQLSRRDRRQLLDGARVEVAPYKEEPGDFVLWKPSTRELPGWDSPWGRGRPGWHIECSAMAEQHLGRTIDIHGGGNDLIFPHHENEIAQSACAHNGKIFARYWMHNGFVNVHSEKMSKSLGNIVLVHELLEQGSGEAIRLALLGAHYRQPLDWSDAVLRDSQRKLDRLYTSLRNVSGWDDWAKTTPSEEFIEALEDDLNTPKALAVLFDLARKINRAGDSEPAVSLARQLRASAEMVGLLGADPAEWFTAGDEGALGADEIEALLVQRAAARDNGDYSGADRIRAELKDLGIAIEDGPKGTSWRRIDQVEGDD
jgi:cysteinyl-tRNA synthetase